MNSHCEIVLEEFSKTELYYMGIRCIMHYFDGKYLVQTHCILSSRKTLKGIPLCVIPEN